MTFLTLAEAARLIESRQLSPVELTRTMLARIEAIDPQINAFITVTAEQALLQARAAEAEIAAGRYRGPMHGIPFGLKDVYETAGILTSAQSKILIDNIPSEDAAVTQKLAAAGGVLLGKLATTEFTHGGPDFDAPWPPARNPWNPEHYTGGSSSGPAAAVAAGMVLGAMGSDTGGSVRIPAALCGTAGFKPTFGIVSRYGVIPNSFSYDHCGPLAWTVEDCAIMLQAVVGHDPRDSGSVPCSPPAYRTELDRDVRGLRIGVIRHFWEEDTQVDAETAKALAAALDVYRDLGARVEDVRMRPLQDYVDVKMVISESEIFAVHQKDLIERPGDFGLPFLAQTLAGCLFEASDYVQAQRERQRMLMEIAPLYQKYDVLITAGSGAAPRFDRFSMLNAWIKPNIYNVFNVTGGPCIAICTGFTGGGLPLSMQIAGRPFDDETVLRAAHAYERATAWRKSRPALTPNAPRVEVTVPPPQLSNAADEATRRIADQCARRAGLKLNEMQFAMLCELAPYALALAQRIRRDHPYSLEPASAFRLRQN